MVQEGKDAYLNRAKRLYQFPARRHCQSGLVTISVR